MSKVLSGCAIRAAGALYDAEKERADDLHYFGAIKLRMETLHETIEKRLDPNESRLLEQISDEIDWVEEKIETLSRK